MPFAPGDLVHVAALGKGVVREVRNGGRYLVEVKGRALVTTADQLTLRESQRKPLRVASNSQQPPEYDRPHAPTPSIDLHGLTIAEALDAVSAFLNRALLGGSAEARVVHGRSGGKIKAAVHAQLKGMGSVRSFRLDPANAGVTIVQF